MAGISRAGGKTQRLGAQRRNRDKSLLRAPGPAAEKSFLKFCLVEVVELLLDLRLPVRRLVPRELDLALQQPPVRKRDLDGLAELLLFEEEPIGLLIGDDLDLRQQPQKGPNNVLTRMHAEGRRTRVLPRGLEH